MVSGTHDGAARFAGGAAGSGAAGASAVGNIGGAGSSGSGNGQGDGEDSSDMGSTGNTPDSIAGASTDEVPSMRNNVRVRSTARLAGEERLLEGVEDTDGQRWFRAIGGACTGSAAAGGGGGGDVGGDDRVLESDDEQALEDMVPSRAFLKLCSSRQHTETIRKMESDERKKKLAERMETADESEKATLTSKLARKRQQDLAMVTMLRKEKCENTRSCITPSEC